MAGRTEGLFKLGVAFYLGGLGTAVFGAAILLHWMEPPTTDPQELGAVMLVVGVGLMAVGWILRKNTRNGA